MAIVKAYLTANPGISVDELRRWIAMPDNGKKWCLSWRDARVMIDLLGVKDKAPVFAEVRHFKCPNCGGSVPDRSPACAACHVRLNWTNERSSPPPPPKEVDQSLYKKYTTTESGEEGEEALPRGRSE